MNILFWFAVVNILPLLALVSLAIRPIRSAIPWLGVCTVVAATVLTFSVSAHLVTGGHDGVGIGPPITSAYGFVGLGIVVASVQLRPVAFVPLGAIVAGIIYISAFYAYLPPFSPDFPGQFIFAVPGFLLVVLGAYLWYRNGLAESLEHRSPVLRLCLTLAIVAGLGSLGYLQFERPGPHKLFLDAPNMSRIAGESALVVEGVVVNKESYKYKPGRWTWRYTLYEMDVTHFWRGGGQETIHFAVPLDVPVKSPVKMKVGQPYLIFSSGMAHREELPGHWSLEYPANVWAAGDESFYPYPGLPRVIPLTRDHVTNLLESNPFIGN